MVGILIGGQAHVLPRMVLAKIRRATPLIDRVRILDAGQVADGVDADDAKIQTLLELLAVWLAEGPEGLTDAAIAARAAEYNWQLTFPEMNALESAMVAALADSGIVAQKGEGAGGADQQTATASPSKPSSTGSSANSSRRASKAAAGT